MDSHADTCSFGPSCLVVHDTEQRISVDPFEKTLGSINDVPIVTAAIAYDCSITYNTYILFFHQSLYFEKLENHLICPNQLRHNNITVNDIPLIHIPFDERSPQHHSIITTPPHPELHIPLSLEGTTSYFVTRKPTWNEVRSDQDCIHVHCTSDVPWNPFDTTLATDESNIRAALLGSDAGARGRTLASLKQSCTNTSAAVDIDGYATAFTIAAASSAPNRKGQVSPEVLAKRWNIGTDTAKKTLQSTTQRAVRDFTHTTGGRRLKPYAYQLRYRRLDVEMYTDVLYGKCKSLRGNTVAMLYCTPFHWMCVEPIPKRADAHYTLDTLFQRVGCPRVLIPDNATELTQGEFRRKALKAQVTIKPVEAYTPNANIAEHGVRELKRAYRRTMIATNSPECLWDCCLEYLALVRSHTALSIRQLDGEVPQTLLTGDTADISHICEFGWYDYVWFISPEDVNMERKKLGRYCGPNFNVGDALCARILTSKGNFVNRTSVFPLSVSDENSDAVKQRKSDFELSLKQALGDAKYAPYKPDPDDPKDVEEATPKYEPYDDGSTPVEELAEADDLDHEAFDKYISARVCLPQGDNMAYGTVKCRKRDASGDLIGKSNQNPIIDTSVYEVQFDTGEVEAYTANKIAKST